MPNIAFEQIVVCVHQLCMIDSDILML